MGGGLAAGILLFRSPVREAVVFSFTCQLSATCKIQLIFFFNNTGLFYSCKNPCGLCYCSKKHSPRTDTQEPTSLIVLKIYFEIASCEVARKFNA